MPRPPWKVIAAMAENRVIGADGGIPWRLPEDFKWVKQCTLEQTIVMGRRTWESLGKPLPRRHHVVISRTLEAVPEGVGLLRSLDELETYDAPGEIWIFGGAEIYRQAMDRVGELYLSLVHQQPTGDTFFPPFEAEFAEPEVICEAEGFTIYRYRREA